MLDDDDDRFLYGDSADLDEPPKPAIQTSVPQPIPLEQVEAFTNTQGVVANLEAKVAGDANDTAEDSSESQDGGAEQGNGEAQGDGEQQEQEQEEQEEEGEGEGEDEEEEESDDDIEIITEKPNRSLDFRQRPPLNRPGQSSSFSTPQRPQQQPAPSLTTEYTPRARDTATNLSATPQPTPGPAGQTTSTSSLTSSENKQVARSDGVDPSTLPVATAPPSHPQIDLEAPGILDGRSIYEIDIAAMAEKNWRRPGADLSDWFNYGFDEISWEAYCYRRREVNELANVLRSNVLSFAGMPEDQVAALPPEVRTMIMALVASGGGNQGGMMPSGMNMNGPMMMPMGPMMGPMMHDMGAAEMAMVGQGMGMGMGGGMGGQGMGNQPMPGPGMGGPGMGPTMNDGALSGGVAMSSAGQVQGGTADITMGMMGDGFQGMPQGPAQQGAGMHMGGEFGMQQEMNQQMYPGVEGAGTPVPSAPASTRGGPPAHFGRGRGIPAQAPAIRGARGGAYAGRGRGGQALPVRPASPLPPNVPTGPRNKNKYKDIDNSAPAVEGLDYGGGKDRSTPPDFEDRGSRKRRSSPGIEEGRGPKRR
ncbi:hypothetical protein BDW22DRAFT_1424418 [Trametopsis cervina]|nr:hypothetical protein BDW22DRAFT_1424418 [Trametopsis cervina]